MVAFFFFFALVSTALTTCTHANIAVALSANTGSGKCLSYSCFFFSRMKLIFVSLHSLFLNIGLFSSVFSSKFARLGSMLQNIPFNRYFPLLSTVIFVIFASLLFNDGSAAINRRATTFSIAASCKRISSQRIDRSTAFLLRCIGVGNKTWVGPTNNRHRINGSENAAWWMVRYMALWISGQRGGRQCAIWPARYSPMLICRTEAKPRTCEARTSLTRYSRLAEAVFWVSFPMSSISWCLLAWRQL